MRFHKYQGLGNDYIVVEPGDLAEGDLPALARAVCDRHFGVGSDGILVEERRPRTRPPGRPSSRCAS